MADELSLNPEQELIVKTGDAGKALKAKITKIELRGSFRQISVGIWLVDF